jgi:hypothetical protein
MGAAVPAWLSFAGGAEGMPCSPGDISLGLSKSSTSL